MRQTQIKEQVGLLMCSTLVHVKEIRAYKVYCTDKQEIHSLLQK